MMGKNTFNDVFWTEVGKTALLSNWSEHEKGIIWMRTKWKMSSNIFKAIVQQNFYKLNHREKYAFLSKFSLSSSEDQAQPVPSNIFNDCLKFQSAWCQLVNSKVSKRTAFIQFLCPTVSTSKKLRCPVAIFWCPCLGETQSLCFFIKF